MEKTYIQRLEEDLLSSINKDLSTLSAEEQYTLIASKAANHPDSIMPIPKPGSNELLKRLELSKKTGKPLQIKLGIDPTGPDIHLGHAIALLMLRRFQRMGHHITLIVGEFTAKIGDPSGNMSERKALTDEEIARNMTTYFQQAGKILDLDLNVKKVKNSEWLAPMDMQAWIPILQNVSASQIFEREDFRKRVTAGGSVSLAEMMYSMFMAYDSVVLQPDIEVGGMDQFLNLHWCRELMRISNQNPEVFICNDLLPGTDGSIDAQGRLAKMSKSKGNYIAIFDKPNDMFGKVMSIPDDVMWVWYRELTEISTEELAVLKSKVESGEIHPMDAKKALARIIVAMLNTMDMDLVITAQQEFERVVQNKDYSEITEEHVLVAPINVVELLLALGFTVSKGEARRLIDQKAVKLNDVVIETYDAMIADEGIFKAGKKRIIRLVK
jgi:tyrosyl-tRNA synthetase